MRYLLSTPLGRLHGVGIVVSRGLAKLGLLTVMDLLYYFPFRWEDYSMVSTIAALRPGNITIEATVESVRLKRTARRGLSVVEAILSDSTGTTKAVWFNQPYLVQTLKVGSTYFFAGEFSFKSNNLAIQSPTFAATLVEGRGGKIVPIYHENSSINSRLLSRLVDQVVALCAELPDVLPADILAKHALLPSSQAIKELHKPTDSSILEVARRTLGFEEMFIMIATGLAARAELKLEVTSAIPFDETFIKNFVTQLPFSLTDAQRKVAWQILGDMSKPSPMNRLVQGDVGSGKTVVALLAAAVAVKAGFQVVLLVPTAILATQHAKTAEKLLKTTGISVVGLTSATSKKERDTILATIASGESQVVIGTHSLLHESVVFANLNLVIIDEQHRFGVEQRQKIKQKAHHMPHLLTMTATPIPRTLALVLYSDLDLSLIDELPPNRIPIETKLFMEIERANAYAQIDDQISAGRQVYVVCPQIDESDTTGARSVTREFERLNRTVFAHRRLALLHGKLSSQEKDQIMSDFLARKFDILVSTTVIEVGVDVPNASVIMIEDADRFGLATLHQLRGRVGRSNHKSYCYLFTSSPVEAAIARLGSLERTQDGLRLAQIDLQNRGAGELYGTMQHGARSLRIADLTDLALVAEVQTAARSFMSKADMVQYPNISRAISAIKKDTTLN